jgi:hypothetical protein
LASGSNWDRRRRRLTDTRTVPSPTTKNLRVVRSTNPVSGEASDNPSLSELEPGERRKRRTTPPDTRLGECPCYVGKVSGSDGGRQRTWTAPDRSPCRRLPKRWNIARLIPVLLLSCLGCEQSGSAKRAEVRSISTAIDRLRQAQNPDKAPKLTELSRVPCSLPDVCDLRNRCVAAYQEQVEALDRIAQGKALLDSERVAAIEQRLERARKLAHECLEFELVVGRRYGTLL